MATAPKNEALKEVAAKILDSVDASSSVHFKLSKSSFTNPQSKEPKRPPIWPALSHKSSKSEHFNLLISFPSSSQNLPLIVVSSFFPWVL